MLTHLLLFKMSVLKIVCLCQRQQAYAIQSLCLFLTVFVGVFQPLGMGIKNQGPNFWDWELEWQLDPNIKKWQQYFFYYYYLAMIKALIWNSF